MQMQKWSKRQMCCSVSGEKRCCSCKRLQTCLQRFGLEPPITFVSFKEEQKTPFLSNWPELVKNLKLHNANLLSYDFSHTRLNPCDRSFPCLYNPQSHSLNFSHLPQHSSFTQLRDGGSKSTTSEQTLHPGNLTAFLAAPSVHGFR